VQTYERAFIDLISVLEAKIEFDQTEALSIFHKSRETIDALAAEMKEHIHASRCYPRLKSGFEVLLLGPPNSGKSSLMNCLSTH
jgi:tRNA modification GTPase